MPISTESNPCFLLSFSVCCILIQFNIFQRTITNESTDEIFTNTFRGSLITAYDKFDEENPPDSYVEYGKDAAERNHYYVQSVTETTLETPSDIDPVDRVIIDLAKTGNTVLFIIIGRIWFQNRNEEKIDKLWKKTSKTLNLLDNSLSKLVKHLKAYESAAVSIFGFEEVNIGFNYLKNFTTEFLIEKKKLISMK